MLPNAATHTSFGVYIDVIAAFNDITQFNTMAEITIIDMTIIFIYITHTTWSFIKNIFIFYVNWPTKITEINKSGPWKQILCAFVVILNICYLLLDFDSTWSLPVGGR